MQGSIYVQNPMDIYCGLSEGDVNKPMTFVHQSEIMKKQFLIVGRKKLVCL